ncbi:hydantoinase/oxoprolinase family protein [Thiolapillus brandeum]|uniref:N-methylhydantoinase A n=1 Tax=Thiolapillus brandeum TaxID=1076588 RepID=A0A7U6JK14_9GAMM|nr:hydantoinase/oxoprolinase family protein [Thiolapillus brandeum]BAO45220.1 N-methylhydantoinase A [Thiolapillus brandeum]
MTAFLGVDTGGTFTDFVLWQDGHIRLHKLLSTPDAPEQAILQGIRELGLEQQDLRVVHGSTVATNAVLEGKGVKTLLITNHGFADMLSLGRQNRKDLYDLQPVPVAPPLVPECCLETGGRLSSRGEVLDEVTRGDLEMLGNVLKQQQPQAVAINLLFSWLDDTAEKKLASALPKELFVSLSSRVLPEIGEYERGMATWLNAWVGPLVQQYLQRLQQGLESAGLSVMQSSGDTVAANQAGEQAVRMLLSGPAGGLVAASHLGKLVGREKLLSFDMGGTSTDVALVDGDPRLTTEGYIGGWPVAVPMVDMHTIGAGGGSIAWLDEGGMLRVGPESAGADPGPACYGRGGTRPTVTDANLILGRLLPEAFLGGRMLLDVDAAGKAMESLARPMGCSATEAAEAVIRVANEHMARALRTMSVQRGSDPAAFTLVSFGGAGGLHVCALAEALGMRQAMVPVHGGVLSALGMLVAAPGRQLSHTWLALLDDLEEQQVELALQKLSEEALSSMEAEGIPREQCSIQGSLDLRYAGQSYTLNIPWSNMDGVQQQFHQLHARRYGHRLDLPLELVNLRLGVRGAGVDVQPCSPPADAPVGAAGYGDVPGEPQPVPCYARDQLVVGQMIEGPALITEHVASTWLAHDWSSQVDGVGNLVLQYQGGS